VFGLAAGVAAGAFVASAPRSAAAPVFTLAGVSVPVMVTNMVLVELTFSIPGVFRTCARAWPTPTSPVIQGTVIAAAVLVALASVAVDVALAWLDPRTRTAAATP
jgi:ABC-type dipeptide/oligopeptide/nickel transport system permease component